MDRYERSSGELQGGALVQRHVAQPEDLMNKEGKGVLVIFLLSSHLSVSVAPRLSIPLCPSPSFCVRISNIRVFFF
jgi:hypothetical protein